MAERQEVETLSLRAVDGEGAGVRLMAEVLDVSVSEILRQSLVPLPLAAMLCDIRGDMDRAKCPACDLHHLAKKFYYSSFVSESIVGRFVQEMKNDPDHPLLMQCEEVQAGDLDLACKLYRAFVSAKNQVPDFAFQDMGEQGWWVSGPGVDSEF